MEDMIINHTYTLEILLELVKYYTVILILTFFFMKKNNFFYIESYRVL